MGVFLGYYYGCHYYGCHIKFSTDSEFSFEQLDPFFFFLSIYLFFGFGFAIDPAQYLCGIVCIGKTLTQPKFVLEDDE